MKNKTIVTALLVLLISAALNILSILLAPFASPDDLGQLAFIIVVFFPSAAFITGILTRRAGLGWAAAAFISALSAAAVILARYNSSGLIYVLIYAVIAIIGYFVSLGLDIIVKRISK